MSAADNTARIPSSPPEVLAKLYDKHGPIMPASYDQAAAMKRVADAVKRATVNAWAPNMQLPQPASWNATAGDSVPCVLTLAELISYEFPEREAILEPWLLTESLSMIHAWRGVGKTHIALGIAYAVATGGKFLTWEATRAWRVLYVDGEMPGAALQKRLKALIDADERDFDPSFLRIITPDAQGEGAMPDLATAEGQAAIEAAAADADLIILDSISTLYRDAGPENDAESWRVAQGWALRMRRAGKAVLFIHHSGKGGAQPSGHQATILTYSIFQVYLKHVTKRYR